MVLRAKANDEDDEIVDDLAKNEDESEFTI
jgi:hypothetical protein